MKRVLTLEHSYSSCVSIPCSVPLPALLSFSLASLFLLYLHAPSLRASLSLPRERKRADTRDLALSPLERRYATVPLMLDLFKTNVSPIGR